MGIEDRKVIEERIRKGEEAEMKEKLKKKKEKMKQEKISFCCNCVQRDRKRIGQVHHYSVRNLFHQRCEHQRMGIRHSGRGAGCGRRGRTE